MLDEFVDCVLDVEFRQIDILISLFQYVRDLRLTLKSNHDRSLAGTNRLDKPVFIDRCDAFSHAVIDRQMGHVTLDSVAVRGNQIQLLRLANLIDSFGGRDFQINDVSRLFRRANGPTLEPRQQ